MAKIKIDANGKKKVLFITGDFVEKMFEEAVNESLDKIHLASVAYSPDGDMDVVLTDTAGMEPFVKMAQGCFLQNNADISDFQAQNRELFDELIQAQANLLELQEQLTFLPDADDNALFEVPNQIAQMLVLWLDYVAMLEELEYAIDDEEEEKCSLYEVYCYDYFDFADGSKEFLDGVIEEYCALVSPRAFGYYELNPDYDTEQGTGL